MNLKLKAKSITSESQITLIKPARGWSLINLRDLWQFRELIYFMTWRDLKVRYKQTFLGVGWAILKPFLTMVVFTIFFGNLAKIQTEGFPYPIFNFTALLPWELFSVALNVASHSLVQNRQMITKIYFPRIILPLSTVVAGLVDFAVAFVILILMLFYYHYPLRVEVLTLPLFLLLAMITSLGVGLWLSALNVLYRDFGYITPFLTQFLMFITPIAYPASLVPEKWRLFYALNPMTGVVEGFRWAMLGSTQSSPFSLLAISTPVAILLLISGMIYFRRMERLFADMV
jgi:lipopolysaccharide transport system permease protein